MTKTIWTSAPAGVLGQGIADARPYPGVVVCPSAEAVRRTRLPSGAVPVAIGDDTARLRPLNGPVAVPTREPRASWFAAQMRIDRQSTQNDVTALGIHSPGRPQS
jgi:hypothetical protein